MARRQGKSKRKSWRAEKGNRTEEEEGWRSRMGGWSGRRSRKEREWRRGAGESRSRVLTWMEAEEEFDSGEKRSFNLCWKLR